MNTVTPLSGLAQRMPIIGTLRNGAKSAKGAPKSLDKFRLTTGSLPYAEAFAGRYGGEVQPWQGNPGQYEVFSDSTEIDIALLPDGFDISYQLWSAAGMQRKCDGVTCEVLSTTGPDNVEYVEQGCICDRKQVLECSLRSRLTFVLPDLPFGGGVIYKTGSKNFAEEAQGMLRLIQQMQAQGINRGYLRLEKRQSSGNRKYTIATVGIRESLEALASGAAGMGALGRVSDDDKLASVESPAIEAPRGSGAPPSPGPHSTSSGGDVDLGEGASPPEEPFEDPNDGRFDEDVVDAEIVEDGPDSTDERGKPDERARLRAKFFGDLDGMSLKYERDVRPWMEAKHDGHTMSTLPIDKLRSLVAALNPDNEHERKEARKRFKAVMQEHAETNA